MAKIREEIGNISHEASMAVLVFFGTKKARRWQSARSSVSMNNFDYLYCTIHLYFFKLFYIIEF